MTPPSQESSMTVTAPQGARYVIVARSRPMRTSYARTGGSSMPEPHPAPSDRVEETCPACGATWQTHADHYRRALAELLEEAKDMRSYVPEYFAKKWHHDEALAAAEEALSR